MEIITVLAKILAVYNLILVIVSLLFNPIVFYVCLFTRTLRANSTFKLLAICSINDVLICLAWNQESFLSTFFDIETSYLNLFYCRFVSTFLQFVTIEFSSWMLVVISLNRFLSMTLANWTKRYFTGIRPLLLAAFLALIIMLINLNEIFLTGYEHTAKNDNETELTVICYSNPPHTIPWYFIMSQILLYFGQVIPFGILIALNGLIIYKATRFERTHHQLVDKRKSQMTKSILIITFLYVVTSLPGTVYNAYQFVNLQSSELDDGVDDFVYGIQFSFQSFNFFILFFTNRVFAKAVREKFSCFCDQIVD